MTDIEIARSVEPKRIAEIAEKAGLDPEKIEPYGRYKAKIDPKLVSGEPGKLILVTAINPTPAGEGKTTVSIGLADALRRLGKNAVLALREPSLGPVFGVKGGAAGGGWAQIIPMEDINLHFTGDLHAITAANNLLAAMVDNHIQQGNALNIDPRRVVWRRCMDMNDRQLRDILTGLGGKSNGMPRSDGFDITAASEVMAVFCLANDMEDLKKRLERIVVAYTFAGEAVTCKDTHGAGRDGGAAQGRADAQPRPDAGGHACAGARWPFANIAHGCNSVIATRTALKMGDYCVTEAGFGARPGRGKVPRHQVPHGGAGPQRGGDRGDGARAQEPRRRAQGGAGGREPGSAGKGHRQPAQARREHAEGVFHARGGRAEPL